MKKLYFAGSAGMLGEAFYRFSSKDFTIKCTDLCIKDDWIDYLDFRNLSEAQHIGKNILINSQYFKNFIVKESEFRKLISNFAKK